MADDNLIIRRWQTSGQLLLNKYSKKNIKSTIYKERDLKLVVFIKMSVKMSLVHRQIFLTIGVIFVVSFSQAEDNPKHGEIFKRMMNETGYREASADCLQASSLTMDQLKAAFKSDEFSEPHYCYFKCMKEKLGFLDADGNLNVEKMMEMPHKMNMEENKMKEHEECLKKIGKIESCQDMAKLRTCSPKMHH